MLKESGYDVEVVDRSTKDVFSAVSGADILITATGQPGLITSDMIKENAVVVDAGVAGEQGKTVGDLDAAVYERDDLTITPQVGGVGPLTICALFDNVIRAARASAESK
jgi:methylenetetrahydrofolate dehydrogenase (NADP+)/methenyltetrahydrofolate cyclohydrolase